VSFLLRTVGLDAALRESAADTSILSSTVQRELVDALVANGRMAAAITLSRSWQSDRDGAADHELVTLLARAGMVDELNARADAGEPAAQSWRINQLADSGQLDEAVTILRAKAADDDLGAIFVLANLLGQHGRIDEATALMRRHADAGNTDVQAWFDAIDRGEPFF
jgi:hypothetical protein